MFDIGWSELLIIAVVTIIVVGPKDLPRLLRSVGQIARKVKQTASEFRGHIDDVIRDAELDDIKSAVDDVKSINPVNQIKKAVTDEVDNVRDIVTETDIRNYHTDFPDDEPYEDFDDPGAEWSDEDDALFDDPAPVKKTDNRKAEKPGGEAEPTDEGTRPANDAGGPDVSWSDEDEPPANDETAEVSTGDEKPSRRRRASR